MDTLAKWGTSLIVLINSVFAILGLVFLACGMLVKVWPEQLASITKMAGNLDKLLPKGSPVHVADINLAAFLDGAATAFIVIGVVLLLLVVWGCCGACCKIRWMLIVYAVILAAIFVGEVALVILFFTERNTLDTALKKPLQESLKLYKGHQAVDATSQGWNAIMALMDCCGVNGYKDFTDLNSWNRNFTATGNDGTTRVMQGCFQVPFVCRKSKSNTDCDSDPTMPDKYSKGCYSTFWEIVDKNNKIAIPVLCAIVIFQATLLFFTIWLARAIRKENQVHSK